MNKSEQTPQLLQLLRERRDTVVSSWHNAIVHTGFTSLATEEVRRRLGDLTDRTITLLLCESFERSKAREIGSGLAGMHYLSPDTLSGTQEVLGRLLIEDLSPDQVAALQPRLAVLLAEVGAGFFGQTRDIILLEQEQIKGALLRERKQVEEALRKSEASLAEAQRIAHVGHFTYDWVNDRLYWSDEIYRIFGLTEQEFGGTFEDYFGRVHPDDREELDAVSEDMWQGRKVDLEHRIIRPNGEVRFLQLRVQFIINRSAVPFESYAGRLNSEEDDKGKEFLERHIQKGSQRLEELPGRPVGVVGTVQDITERKWVEGELRKAHDELELRIRERTAELARANEELQAEITERIRTEKALRHSESSLAAAQRIASLGNWEYVLDEDRAWWSDELFRIFGSDPQEFTPTYEKFFEFVHPDDRRTVRKELVKALRGEDRSEVEYRIVRSNGEVRRAHIQYEVIRSASGTPIKIVGTTQDVTERKGIEEALRQSERLFRTVVKQAAENIFLVDAETKRIHQANAALHQSLGYTTEELRQMTLYDIVAHDRESIDRTVRRVIQKGYLYVGEQQYRRKDGSLMDVEVSVSVIPQDDRETLCIVAHDVTEYKRAEESLRQSLSMLLALREAGQILGSTLESEEVVSRLLEIMQRVSNLTATVISVQNEDGRVRIWRSVGLEGLWKRARYAQEALDARRTVLETEEHQLFLLQRPGSETEHLVGLYLPLRTRERIIGVLEAYGSESLAESDTVEVLASLASQAASAFENARLYGELGEREHRLQDLVGRLLGAQEEERRRVAYEVHDGLAQVAAAAHQHLQAFARRYPPSMERGQRDLERVLNLVRKTVSEGRRIIANLRPTTLDDLGLAATISMEVESLREEDYEVEYKEELGGERLPTTVEITLFRVLQEALTNIRKHAYARRLRIELRRQKEEVYLEVQDYGRGFDPTVAAAGRGPGERVGLAGMRERVGMLGGKFEIHGQPGVGTSVIAEVPLPAANSGASISAGIT